MPLGFRGTPPRSQFVDLSVSVPLGWLAPDPRASMRGPFLTPSGKDLLRADRLACCCRGAVTSVASRPIAIGAIGQRGIMAGRRALKRQDQKKWLCAVLTPLLARCSFQRFRSGSMMPP